MKDVLRWGVLGGLFLLPLLPLLVTDSLFFPYITGKNFAFRIIVEVVFAAWVVLALYDSAYRPRVSWILGAFTAFVGVVLVADLAGVAPAKSLWSNFERMEGFVTIVHLFLYFVVASSMLTTVRLWRGYLNTTLAVAALVALYAFAQLVGLVGIMQGGVRIDATLGNAIYMAVYMLFAIFIALYLAVRAEQAWVRAGYGALALIFASLLIMTGTRGTVLGLVGGLGVSALYAAWVARGDRRVRRGALAALLAIILLGSSFYLVRDSAFVRESPVLSRIASISLEAGATRFAIWDIALTGFRERPLLGWGQENFNYVFNQHYVPVLYTQEPWFDRVHNVYLDWLIAAGVLGLGAYLALWGAALFSILRVRGSADEQESGLMLGERAVLLGLLAGYAIHNLFVFDNLISSFFFATILALVYVQASRAERPLFAGKVPAQWVTYGALPLATFVFVAVVYTVNVPHIQTAKRLIEGLSYVNAAESGQRITEAQYTALLDRGLAELTAAVELDSFAAQEVGEHLALAAGRVYLSPYASDEVKVGYAVLAERTLTEQVGRYPNDARAHVFLGTFYRTVGETERALEALAMARTLSPGKPQFLLDIGVTHMVVGAYGPAHESFAEALAMAPGYRDARAYAISAAVYAGERERVDALSASPYEEVYVTHDAVLDAYYRLGQYDEVVAILDARIERTPAELPLWVTKAVILEQAGQVEAAVATLEEAMAAFPAFAAEGATRIAEMRADE